MYTRTASPDLKTDRKPLNWSVTVFYELEGEGARGALEAFALTLEAAGAAPELLESATQPGLFLLLCRDADAPLPGAPAGIKVWQFRAVR